MDSAQKDSCIFYWGKVTGKGGILSEEKIMLPGSCHLIGEGKCYVAGPNTDW